MTTDTLPPLPKSYARLLKIGEKGGEPCYTADQMRDYARAALASRPAQAAAVGVGELVTPNVRGEAGPTESRTGRAEHD